MNRKRFTVFIILFIFILSSMCVFAADENTTTESYRIKPLQDKLVALISEDIDGYLNKFTDVKKHWAASYIGMLSALGIVSGNGNGTFKPDYPVQADQFIKMTVRALGYTPVESKDYNDWRFGRVDFLEKVCQVNLRVLSGIMKEIRVYAVKNNLKSSWTCYHQWGKNKDRRLRFSKSNEEKIERNYATHFVNTELMESLRNPSVSQTE